MEYVFLNKINKEEINLSPSPKINKFLFKNHYADIIKVLDFFASEDKFLYIHGFLGTGKRQVIDYSTDYLHKDVVVLEYFCRSSTVCDDILLDFIDKIEKNSMSKAVIQTAKITTLNVKFQQYISAIKKPFMIILHSFDDVETENMKLITDCMSAVIKSPNVKLLVSTRAMLQSVMGDVKINKKIFLKALSKDIFEDFIRSSKIQATEETMNDFYKYSRGYYYYTILSVKIMQAMKMQLEDFISKFTMSGMSFDSFLGLTYVNLIPDAIRNFFWFLRTIRHGISANALAILELYDDFAVGYLKNNLMIFQVEDMLYVQDYFQQDIDISIPAKTEIKLHKYIVSIYEKELKQPLASRAILISRQALRAEIEYHNKKIYELENGQPENKQPQEVVETETKKEESLLVADEHMDVSEKMEQAKNLAEKKRYTEAIEAYVRIIEDFSLDMNTLAEIRTELARLYYAINNYENAQHYYNLAENYYKKNNEFINLNYLYYELTALYYSMYKNDRAIETAKKVVYSVDTPQSLMVDACIRLGNIYSDIKNPDEAYKYYIKALESVDENTQAEKKSELYFKLALVCDDKEDSKTAFEYYNKCIQTEGENSFKALSYSNLGACYYENENYSDAEACFMKAYNIEKTNNNYDGIYYASSYLAKIYIKNHSDKAIDFLLDAKQSAEFINEDFYILEATIALGDYYYDHKSMTKKALIEYLNARRIARNLGDVVDIDKIEERINDMKLRVSQEDFDNLESKYG